MRGKSVFRCPWSSVGNPKAERAGLPLGRRRCTSRVPTRNSFRDSQRSTPARKTTLDPSSLHRLESPFQSVFAFQRMDEDLLVGSQRRRNARLRLELRKRNALVRSLRLKSYFPCNLFGDEQTAPGVGEEFQRHPFFRNRSNEAVFVISGRQSDCLRRLPGCLSSAPAPEDACHANNNPAIGTIAACQRMKQLLNKVMVNLRRQKNPGKPSRVWGKLEGYHINKSHRPLTTALAMTTAARAATTERILGIDLGKYKSVVCDYQPNSGQVAGGDTPPPVNRTRKSVRSTARDDDRSDMMTASKH